MTDSQPVFVYVTVPDMQTAERIADTAVGERLAACANILPGMQSIYHWQGKIEKAEEVVVILKTSAARFAEIETRIKTMHPYETPCIIALPITAVHAPYLRWIEAEIAPRD